jgi:hypothetical protein
MTHEEKVLELEQRIQRLEEQCAKRQNFGHSKRRSYRSPYVDVDQVIIDERWNTWAALWGLDPNYRGMLSTKARTEFAQDAHLSAREFRRWFEKRGTHAVGSAKDLEYREAIRKRLVLVRIELATSMGVNTSFLPLA